ESNNDRRWSWYFLAMVLYVAALLSKSVACSLPAAVLLILWWQRGKLTLRDVRAMAPFFVLGVCSGLLTVWLEKYYVRAEGRRFDLSLIERVLIAGRAVWFYAAKLVWPMNLTFIYPRWQIDPALWWQYTYPAGVLGVVGLLWLLRRRLGRGPL